MQAVYLVLFGDVLTDKEELKLKKINNNNGIKINALLHRKS